MTKDEHGENSYCLPDGSAKFTSIQAVRARDNTHEGGGGKIVSDYFSRSVGLCALGRAIACLTETLGVRVRARFGSFVGPVRR